MEPYISIISIISLIVSVIVLAFSIYQYTLLKKVLGPSRSASVTKGKSDSIQQRQQPPSQNRYRQQQQQDTRKSGQDNSRYQRRPQQQQQQPQPQQQQPPPPQQESFSDEVRQKVSSMGADVKELVSDLGIERSDIGKAGDWLWVRYYKPNWPRTFRGVYLMWFEIRHRSNGTEEILIILTPNIQGFRHKGTRLSGYVSRMMISRLREYSGEHPEVWGTSIKEKRGLHGSVQLDTQKIPEQNPMKFCAEYIRTRIPALIFAMEEFQFNEQPSPKTEAEIEPETEVDDAAESKEGSNEGPNEEQNS